jgi:hypothetical protein
MARLLGREAFGEVTGLWERFSEDRTAMWLYSGALVKYRQGDAIDEADELLGEALKQNRYVPLLLSGRALPRQSVESEDIDDNREEAADIADILGDAWSSTQGALDWLEDTARRKERNRAKNKRKRR